MKKFRRVLSGAVCVFCILVLAAGCGKKESQTVGDAAAARQESQAVGDVKDAAQEKQESQAAGDAKDAAQEKQKSQAAGDAKDAAQEKQNGQASGNAGSKKQAAGDAGGGKAEPEETGAAAAAPASLPAPGTVVKSGKWGDNVTYTLDDKGILTISGTGDMSSIEEEEKPERDAVLYIVIEEGIEKALNLEYPNLRYVSLPSTIKKFGFGDCDALEAVVLAEGIAEIGDSDFEMCDSLTSVTLPESVTTVGSAAFVSCSSLASIDVPDTVTHIGSAAFAGTAISEFAFPHGETVIRSEMFSQCEKLASVTLHKGITSIEEWAFYECGNLKDVYYEGTEEEFKKIKIGGSNEALLAAEIHYGQ